MSFVKNKNFVRGGKMNIKKITKNILIIALIINVCLLFNPIKAHAGLIDNIQTAVDSFKGLGEKKATDTITSDIFTPITDIANLLWGIGIVVVFIKTLTLGITYARGTGSDKGGVKESLIRWLVASAVIVGAWGIWEFIVNLSGDILSS